MMISVSSSAAVKNIIGTLETVRMFRHRSKPEPSGSATSKITRSYFPLFHSRPASALVRAIVSSYPCFLIAKDRPLIKLRSSSTKKMCFIYFLHPPFCACLTEYLYKRHFKFTETPPLYGTLPLEVSSMAKMILIIEDEESIQNIIRAFLEDAGYTVVLAADGMEGIKQFRANKPDLVLLDCMLPKIDGFAVCEILRKESRVPIIMLTALDDD